ncbi:MAG: CBS domain-containing protein [Candidatus Riflebacteria bacterium]|nr:CBS domain-containing protein [Candidatus Riflebacteria bacterium]
MLRLAGYQVGIASLAIDSSPSGLSDVLEKYQEILGVDAAFGIFATDPDRCIVIGRAGFGGIDVGAVVRALGGGGHPGAGSAMVKSLGLDAVSQRVIELVSRHEGQDVPVRRIMSRIELTVEPAATMAEASKTLEAAGRRALLVVEGDRLLGVLSTTELAKAKTDTQLRAPVKSFMRTRLKTLAPEQGLRDAARLMQEEDSGLLPVLQDGALVGVVTAADLMLQLYGA